MIETILLGLVAITLYSFLMYPKRRERIEMTCNKEHPLKTYADEWITNFFVAIPIYATGFVVYIIYSIL